jgi:predicted nucleic acid-binding protein
VEAVVSELAAGRKLGISLPDVVRVPWIDIRHPCSRAGVLLAWDLGAGESASLSLALESSEAWVVLDDRIARQAAGQLKIPLLGTAGILLRAKGAHQLEKVGPLLAQLASLGFRLKPETHRTILKLAGEGQ